LSPADAEKLKYAAAARAIEFVRPGMRLGLGTGSTAKHFVTLLGERVRGGLDVIGVPTSEATRADAEQAGVPLATLDEQPALDLTVDGADEIAPDLTLIKGGGGALLREKIVAASSKRMIVIADDTKLVDRLGNFPLPVEIISFGHATTIARVRKAIAALGYGDIAITPRMNNGAMFRTDSNNLIVDCAFGAIADAPALAGALCGIPGVVDHGLFIGLATTLIIAGAGGVRVIEKS
jgi:ribose 5-phosphate isomerase A